MSNVNTATISGNLTRDPETAWVSDDGETAIVKFGLASNRQRKVEGEYVEETCFIDVTVFGKFANLVARKMKKADSATVTGRLQYESWEKDGEKRNKLILVAQEIDSDAFYRSKDEENDALVPEPTAEPVGATAVPTDDDIPF